MGCMRGTRKGKQNWFILAKQKERGKSQIKLEMKEETLQHYNWCHKNTKNPENTIIHQENEWPERCVHLSSFIHCVGLFTHYSDRLQ